MKLSWVCPASCLSLAETANWAGSGNHQFWSEPSEIINLRSSNTPETVDFMPSWYQTWWNPYLTWFCHLNMLWTKLESFHFGAPVHSHIPSVLRACSQQLVSSDMLLRLHNGWESGDNCITKLLSCCCRVGSQTIPVWSRSFDPFFYLA